VCSRSKDTAAALWGSWKMSEEGAAQRERLPHLHDGLARRLTQTFQVFKTKPEGWPDGRAAYRLPENGPWLKQVLMPPEHLAIRRSKSRSQRYLGERTKPRCPDRYQSNDGDGSDEVEAGAQKFNDELCLNRLKSLLLHSGNRDFPSGRMC